MLSWGYSSGGHVDIGRVLARDIDTSEVRSIASYIKENELKT